MVKVFDSDAKVHRAIPSLVQKFVSIAVHSITASDYGAGALDDKDLTVNSD